MAPTKPLTIHQANVVSFIRRYGAEAGWAPSIREIGAEFGTSSTNAVTECLRLIERKGYIQRGRGQSRAIRVLFDEWGQPVARPGDAS